MRIGIISTAVGYLPTWDAKFARLKELGYDALDHNLFDIEQMYYKDVAVMEEHCREVRAAAEKNDLEIYQVHGPWPTNDTTEESRAVVWDCMHRAVYGCYLLGSKHLVIHPQMPYGWDADEDPDAAEEMTVALMKELLPDCEKYGVVLCLENMPFRKQRISPMKYIVEAVKKVNSPFAGICLDTGHCNFLHDNIAENVRLAAPYLKALHIHDNKTFADSHLLPMLGNIDWLAFAKALAESGYDGVLSLETGNVIPEKMSPAVCTAYENLAVETIKQISQMVEDARNGN